MARTIGIGVIGMGWMGHVHSRSYRQIPDRFYDSGIRPRLVICADEVASRAQQSQEMFGFEKSTTNWRDVITCPGVEVVNITAPNYLHVEMVQAATEAKKHVVCEKPVGRSPEETAHNRIDGAVVPVYQVWSATIIAGPPWCNTLLD